MLVKIITPNVYGIARKNGKSTIIFIPGINKISGEDWEEIKANPGIKKRIENKTIEIVDDREDVESSETLKNHNSQKAIELVTQTLDKNLLEKWKELETRTTVLKAIDKQLGLLELKKEDDGS